MVYLSENLRGTKYFTLNKYKALHDEFQFMHLEGAFLGIF